MDEDKKIYVKKLISYSDDLVRLLNDQKDIIDLIHSVKYYRQLRSRCRSDHHQHYYSLQEFQKKIDLFKKKTVAAKAEVASDAEIHLLQKEMDEELQREALLLEELRAITNQFKDLEEQRNLNEERRQDLKKLEQDEMKAQMKLSMYASVTTVIPDLNDQSKKSGHIVDKEKKVVKKIELSSHEMNDYETCNAIWNMITR